MSFIYEDIVLPDGTKAKKSTIVFNGETSVSILTPEIMVHFVPNDDGDGGDHKMWSHWDEELQKVVPNGYGNVIDVGKNKGKPSYWQDENGKWFGLFSPVDYKSILESYVKWAKRYLKLESSSKMEVLINHAEALLNSNDLDFYMDKERTQAKELSKPLKKYIDEQDRIEWELMIKRQKEKLVKEMNGKFIEKEDATQIMKIAEYKTIKELNPWSNTVIPNSGSRRRPISYLYYLMIKYEEKWLKICRVDLDNQCPTTQHNMDGTHNSKEVWIKSIAYGVVVTDKSWYIVDSLTDG